MAALNIQDHYDDEDYEHHLRSMYYEINHDKFHKASNTQFVMSQLDPVLLLLSLLPEDIGDNYFCWLPTEILAMIGNYMRQLIIDNDYSFYKNYFSDDESVRKVCRQLRVRPEVRPAGAENPVPRYIRNVDTPLGTIKRQNFFVQNQAQSCAEAFEQVIVNGVKSIVGLESLFGAVKDWMIWICDHIDYGSWERFFYVLMAKIHEIYHGIKNVALGYEESKYFTTQKDKRQAYDIMNYIMYFIDTYVPYTLLTRSDAHWEARLGVIKEDDEEYFECLKHNALAPMIRMIYEHTDIHPENFNLNDVKEFELMCYAPTYYYNVYENYMMLRSGRRLIPNGEKPRFYWRGNTFVPFFI